MKSSKKIRSLFLKKQTHPTSIFRMIFATVENRIVSKNIVTAIDEEKLVETNAIALIATIAHLTQN